MFSCSLIYSFVSLPGNLYLRTYLKISSHLSLFFYHVSIAQSSSHTHVRVLVLPLSCIIQNYFLIVCFKCAPNLLQHINRNFVTLLSNNTLPLCSLAGHFVEQYSVSAEGPILLTTQLPMDDLRRPQLKAFSSKFIVASVVTTLISVICMNVLKFILNLRPFCGGLLQAEECRVVSSCSMFWQLQRKFFMWFFYCEFCYFLLFCYDYMHSSAAVCTYTLCCSLSLTNRLSHPII